MGEFFNVHVCFAILSEGKLSAQKTWENCVLRHFRDNMAVMKGAGKISDEPAMVLAATEGSRAAFGGLVDLHKDGVLVFLSVRLHDRSEAEDLAQETFLTAWRRLAEFDPGAPFGPWLRGIAHNLLRNHWRKHRAQPVGGNEELDFLLGAGEDSFTEILDDKTDALEALRQCMLKLSAPSRDLIRKRYEDGASIAELSESLGHKTSALSMRLHRIRADLKTCIEKQSGVTA